MADIGKEAEKINEDLNQVSVLLSNPLVKYIAIGVFAIIVLVILKF